MKISIEFNMPKEKREFELTQKAFSYHGACERIQLLIRERSQKEPELTKMDNDLLANIYAIIDDVKGEQV